ncbi:cellulose binding domain-containing protein [Microbispora sp. NBC_01189]|uniref:cellulose binding domain-containing protein n=1 Tax=Microbispora sp. NBC_01189 TaxID=2903583 RepID=UPI002E0E8688
MTHDQNGPTSGERRVLSRRSVLTTLGAVPVVTATSAVLGATEASAATATVNPSAQRQTIKGFGGMAHAAWIGDLTAAQRDTAFQTGEGKLGFSILRIPVGESQADFGRDLATAQRAAQLGVTVFASPWNPPASMIETFNRNGQTNAKRLRADQYAAYATHLNSFSTYMKNNGVNLYAISVQNEPDYANDWTWWTPTEMVKFLRENAGSINTRVMAPESFQYLKNMSDPILNDSTALANTDIIGAHLYGTAYSNFPYPLFKQKGAGKELWMTEVYYPNSTDSADTWPQALDVGEHMHRAMVEAEFQAYVWWYIRRSYGPMREDGQLSKRGAIMAQFARFVRPGYVRIDATANPATNVYVSAYRSGDTVVIVAINKGTSAASQQFTVAGAGSAGVSSWVTDGSRNVAPQAATTMSNGSLTVTLPARSMTTYVTSLSGSSPSATPTVTPTVTPTQSPSQSPSQSPTGGTGAARVAYTMNSWSTGFTASISITNTGSSTINGWTLAFTLPSGQTITSGWNATFSPSSGQVSARNVDYNATIAPGATVDIGFQANHSGNTSKPTSFTLNGVPCTVV